MKLNEFIGIKGTSSISIIYEFISTEKSNGKQFIFNRESTFLGGFTQIP